eukprot:INCI1106.4.p1 GENE.INCI1106.4~~INCI1106.4.p1  ORF type:complete len:569 (-),score=59.76 INCI1106.4:1196-2902(-)
MLPRYYRSSAIGSNSSTGGAGRSRHASTPARPSSTHHAQDPASAVHRQPLHPHYNPHAGPRTHLAGGAGWRGSASFRGQFPSTSSPLSTAIVAPPTIGGLVHHQSVGSGAALHHRGGFGGPVNQPSLVSHRGPLVLDHRGPSGKRMAAPHSSTSGSGISALQQQHEASIRSLHTPARRGDQRRGPHSFKNRYSGLTKQLNPEHVQKTPQPKSEFRRDDTQPGAHAREALPRQQLFTPSKKHIGGYSGRPDNSTAREESRTARGQATHNYESLHQTAVLRSQQRANTDAKASDKKNALSPHPIERNEHLDETDTSVRETDSELIAGLFDEAIANENTRDGRASDEPNGGEIKPLDTTRSASTHTPSKLEQVDGAYKEEDPAANGVSAPASTSRRKLSPSKEGTPRNAAGQAMGLIPWKGSSPQRSPFQNHYQLQNTSAVPQLNPHHQASPQSARRFNSSKGSYSRIGDPRANQVATRRLSDTAESIQVSMLLTRCHDHEATIEKLVEDRQRHRRELAEVKALLAEQTVRADKAESDSKKLKASTARLRGQVVNLEAELKQRLRQEVEVG